MVSGWVEISLRKIIISKWTNEREIDLSKSVTEIHTHIYTAEREGRLKNLPS